METMFMVALVLVAVVANLAPLFKKQPKFMTNVKPSTYVRYKTKEQFINAMEAEHQQWLNELRSIYESAYTPSSTPDIPEYIRPKKQPEEKVLTVKSSRVLDRSGKEYLTIAEVLAVLI